MCVDCGLDAILMQLSQIATIVPKLQIDKSGANLKDCFTIKKLTQLSDLPIKDNCIDLVVNAIQLITML